MRKVYLIINILRKHRRQESHHEVYEEVGSDVSKLKLYKSLHNGDLKVNVYKRKSHKSFTDLIDKLHPKLIYIPEEEHQQYIISLITIANTKSEKYFKKAFCITQDKKEG